MKQPFSLTWITFAILGAVSLACGTGSPIDGFIGISPAPAAAATPSSECSSKYLGGVPPVLPAAQARGAITLCNIAYTSTSSPSTRTPLWSAELLTPASLATAMQTDRVSEFHPDDRLAPADRAELADYRGSGWDRGHLAPSGDMPGLDAQAESFSLANIVPQAPLLNRESWATLESNVRTSAKQRDTTYVVTGALFEGNSIMRTPSGRVLIPTSLWKAIAARGQGGVVYVATNSDTPVWKHETVAAFQQETGIDPFPSMSQDDRTRLLRIPG